MVLTAYKVLELWNTFDQHQLHRLSGLDDMTPPRVLVIAGSDSSGGACVSPFPFDDPYPPYHFHFEVIGLYGHYKCSLQCESSFKVTDNHNMQRLRSGPEGSGCSWLLCHDSDDSLDGSKNDRRR